MNGYRALTDQEVEALAPGDTVFIQNRGEAVGPLPVAYPLGKMARSPEHIILQGASLFEQFALYGNLFVLLDAPLAGGHQG